VDLVHRRSVDRIVSAFYKVRRYRCRGAACGWTGVLRSTHGLSGKAGKGMKFWVWAIVIAVSLAGALAMVAYLESRPSADSTEESP
jgi:hypothetical protein